MDSFLYGKYKPLKMVLVNKDYMNEHRYPKDITCLSILMRFISTMFTNEIYSS